MLRRLWEAWAGPWRAWESRLLDWLAGKDDASRCATCGYPRADAGGLGPSVCPRCGTRYAAVTDRR